MRARGVATSELPGQLHVWPGIHVLTTSDGEGSVQTTSRIDLTLRFLKRYQEAGLLIIRIGVGSSFLALHGWDKLVGGPGVWVRYGTAMPGFGIEWIYVFWGFMAALVESLGAVLFVAGFLFRPAAGLLGFTMAVAVFAHISDGDPWVAASHALQLAFVFLGLAIAGPGRYSLDHRLAPKG